MLQNKKNIYVYEYNYHIIILSYYGHPKKKRERKKVNMRFSVCFWKKKGLDLAENGVNLVKWYGGANYCMLKIGPKWRYYCYLVCIVINL